PQSIAIDNAGSFLWIGNVGSSTISYLDLASCRSQGSPCQSQGSIQYSPNTATAQPPDDIVLAPGTGS
ncbi:MAG: hypothetical protein KGR26_13750, partial [Cyanobacteria bacterium REEB65]|nr:hypothetical protein [Cyanobacteria bacterium REEB65]